jgi:hypothetical protein
LLDLNRLAIFYSIILLSSIPLLDPSGGFFVHLPEKSVKPVDFKNALCKNK